MICCDNAECLEGQWFHLSCLKLKKAPRVRKWYAGGLNKKSTILLGSYYSNSRPWPVLYELNI